MTAAERAYVSARSRQRSMAKRGADWLSRADAGEDARSARAALVAAGYDRDWIRHLDEVARLSVAELAKKLEKLGMRNTRARHVEGTATTRAFVAVELADEALVPGEVAEKAEALRAVFDRMGE